MKGAGLIVLIYLFILGSIVDRLQRQGYMPGIPLFSVIPGWALWYDFFNEFPGGYMTANILRERHLWYSLPPWCCVGWE